MTTFTIQFGDGVPQDDGTGRLNAQVRDAVAMLTARYRHYKCIPEWTVLTHEQIDEILFDLRDLIYKHEGISKPKKK